MADGTTTDSTLSSIAREIMEKHKYDKDKAMKPYLARIEAEGMTGQLLRRGAWEALSDIHRAGHTEAFAAARNNGGNGTRRKPFVGPDDTGGMDALARDEDTLDKFFVHGELAIMKCKDADLEKFEESNAKRVANASMQLRFAGSLRQKYTKRHPSKILEELASKRAVFDLLCKAQEAA